MKTFLTTTAVALGLTAGAAGAATWTIDNVVAGNTVPGNDFSTELGLALGAGYSFGTLDSVTAAAGETFRFWEVAAESGFNNTFTVAGAGFVTETSSFFNNFAVALGSPDIEKTYGAATTIDSTQNSWAFSSSGGSGSVPGTMGTDPFGVFFNTDQDLFVLAYDDQNPAGSDDDNHDDYLVFVTSKVDGVPNNPPIVPVPASALLLGGALAGLGFARRRKAKKS